MSDLIDRDRVCKTLMDDCHIKIMSGNNWIRLEEAVARLAGLPTMWMCDKCYKKLALRMSFPPYKGEQE